MEKIWHNIRIDTENLCRYIYFKIFQISRVKKELKLIFQSGRSLTMEHSFDNVLLMDNL